MMHVERNKIEFKASMLKSSLCDYSDAYILVIGTITIDEEGDMMLQNKQTKEIKK